MAKADLEEIKSRLNIVDVLGQYLRLEKAGANHRALCPFHNEKSPSFMVSEDKQIWKCFGCGKGGDIFSFVMEIEGLDFREALKILAEKAGVTLPQFDPREESRKSKVLEILELATKFYEVQLWKGAGKEKIMKYLRERGLKDESIREFRLGYAPAGWRNLLDFLIKRGHNLDDVKRTGVLVEKDSHAPSSSGASRFYDRFRDRIMFPIADYSGKILGFSARVAPGGDEKQAKYVNTPETEVYHKSRILYGLDKARGEMKTRDFALLVEGNMDVIACWQSGIKNAVAVSGTALTEEQLGIIKRYTGNVRMFFDMDSAGENATQKSVKLCLDRGIDVKVVQLPSGKDAAEIARENPETLRLAVSKAKNVLEYFFENVFRKYDVKNPDEKKKAVENLLDKIGMLKFLPEQNHWIKKLAEKINEPGRNILEDEKALTDMLKKANLEKKMTSTSGSREAAGNFAFRKKMEVLADDLLGLMLIFGEVWEKVVREKNPAVSFLKTKDSLLDFLLEKGEEARFDFDRLPALFDSEETKTRAEKIFLEKKFRFNLNNQIEEVFIEDPFGELAKLVREISREIKREELEKISRDLKLAEEKNDQAAVSFLRRESQRLSQEIASL